MFLSWSVPGAGSVPGGQQVSCLSVATLRPTALSPHQHFMTEIRVFQVRTALFSHVRKHAEHGTRVRDVEMRKSGDDITHYTEGGRWAAASPGWRANLWHHMGLTGRQWEEDAGINEMRNPIWSTCQAARPTTRLYSERTSSISSPINMDFGKLFCLGRAGIILYIFIDNLSSTLMFYYWSLSRLKSYAPLWRK